MAPASYTVSVQVSNSLRPLLLVRGVAAKAAQHTSMQTDMHTNISTSSYICMIVCVCIYENASEFSWLTFGAFYARVLCHLLLSH